MPAGRFAIALSLALLLPIWCHAAESPLPRVAVRLLPFTGVVLPHQQLAGHRAAPPLGVGLEIYYTPRISLAVDASTSWHDDLQLSSFQILGRWWFPRAGWVPFVEGGAGGYQAELHQDGGSRKLGGVGLALGGGVEVPVAANCFVQLDLRSNWVHGQDSDGPEAWIGHTQALAWLGYKLP